MKFDGRTLFGAVVVGLALLSVVVGGGLAAAQGNAMSLTDDADGEESIAANNVSLSEEDAIDVATAEANGSVDEVELESEDGTPIYEVELVTSSGDTEVTVHANDGTVLETESEAEEDEMDEEDEIEDKEMDEEDEESVGSANVSLSEQDAIDVATGEVNGTVEEVELESENGTPAYEVEFAESGDTETEVTVHANDGTVLDTETEDE